MSKADKKPDTQTLGETVGDDVVKETLEAISLADPATAHPSELEDDALADELAAIGDPFAVVQDANAVWKELVETARAETERMNKLVRMALNHRENLEKKCMALQSRANALRDEQSVRARKIAADVAPTSKPARQAKEPRRMAGKVK